MIKSWIIGSIAWVALVYFACNFALGDKFRVDLGYQLNNAQLGPELRSMIFWMLAPPAVAAVVLKLFFSARKPK